MGDQITGLWHSYVRGTILSVHASCMCRACVRHTCMRAWMDACMEGDATWEGGAVYEAEGDTPLRKRHWFQALNRPCIHTNASQCKHHSTGVHQSVDTPALKASGEAALPSEFLLFHKPVGSRRI